MKQGRRIFVAILCILMFMDVSLAQTLQSVQQSENPTAGLVALPVHVGGRVMLQPNTAPQSGYSYTHQWPGVYFEANLNGSNVVLKFADAFNEYRLFIDDHAAITLKQPGTVDIEINSLGQGKHQLRLEKVTESIEVVGAFQGFYVAAPGNVETVGPRKRQIEFIGDSNMTGYGLRSKSRTCSQEEIRLLSDTQSSYPALVGKQFEADYQVNAVSGRGMVRNYDGFSPDIALPKIYPYALLDAGQPYVDATWRPQITFIALGANDFATDLKPEETWKSDPELFKSYLTELKRFLNALHDTHPETALIISWTDMISYMGDADKHLAIAGQQDIRDAARAIGFKSVDFIPMDDLGLTAEACDYHATAADHQKLKKWLAKYLNTHSDLWQGQ